MSNRRIKHITAKIVGASSAETFDIYDESAIHKFDTFATMAADANVKAGDVCQTAGYYAIDDGGGALYSVSSTSESGKYNVQLANNLYAIMICDDIVTPEQFGAKGNGVDSDTAALRDCFAYGTNILIPEGKAYPFWSYIPVKSNTRIQLDGTLKAIGDHNDDSIEFFSRDVEAPGYSGVHDVILSGKGTIDMQGDVLPESYATPIRIHHAKNILIQGITIKNYSQFHAIEIGGSTDITLDGIKIKGCFANGNTGSHEAIQLESINEGGTSGAIPYDGTLTKNITIKNCLFTGSAEGGLAYRAIGAHSNYNDSTWTNFFDNIDIIDNVFENNQSITIMFDSNVKNMRIVGNEFIDNASYASIHLANYMRDCNIENNTFRGNQQNVIWIGSNASTVDTSNRLDRIVIRNNTILNYNQSNQSGISGVAMLGVNNNCSIVDNTLNFPSNYSNQPFYLSPTYAPYSTNFVVEGNTINGKYVSMANTFEHSTSSSNLSDFLASRISKLLEIAYVQGITGVNEKNVYCIYGSRSGYYDVLSIAYYDKTNQRVTMTSYPQPTNLQKIIVSQYQNGSYSHYQTNISALSE